MIEQCFGTKEGKSSFLSSLITALLSPTHWEYGSFCCKLKLYLTSLFSKSQKLAGTAPLIYTVHQIWDERSWQDEN